MRAILTLCLVVLTGNLHAAEKKAPVDVDVDAMTAETQSVQSSASGMTFAWWIPVEFWEANWRQSGQIPPDQIGFLIDTASEYSILAVAQAEVSPFGAFSFYSQEDVLEGLKFQVREGGNLTTLEQADTVSPDMTLLISQMRPVVAAVLGQMGQNLHFAIFPAMNGDGDRIPSPYEKNEIVVEFGNGDEAIVLDIELPLDSLFVPRVCPNGKPAHVSWSYCPWSGKALED